MLSWRVIIAMISLSLCLPKHKVVDHHQKLTLPHPLIWKVWRQHAKDCDINSLFGVKKIITHDEYFDVIVDHEYVLTPPWTLIRDHVWRCSA